MYILIVYLYMQSDVFHFSSIEELVNFFDFNDLEEFYDYFDGQDYEIYKIAECIAKNRA